MWEPRALALFQVVCSGLCTSSTSNSKKWLSGIHSQQSDHLIQSCREDLPQPAVGSALLHPGTFAFPFLDLCTNGAFFIFKLLFPIILCEILCTEMVFETLVWQNLVTVIFNGCFEQYWSNLETPFVTQINSQSCYFLIYGTRFYLLIVHISLKQKL